MRAAHPFSSGARIASPGTAGGVSGMRLVTALPYPPGRSTGINLTCVRFILYISYYANIILSVESGVGLNAFSATVKDGFRHHG